MSGEEHVMANVTIHQEGLSKIIKTSDGTPKFW